MSLYVWNAFKQTHHPIYIRQEQKYITAIAKHTFEPPQQRTRSPTAVISIKHQADRGLEGAESLPCCKSWIGAKRPAFVSLCHIPGVYCFHLLYTSPEDLPVRSVDSRGFRETEKRQLVWWAWGQFASGNEVREREDKMSNRVEISRAKEDKLHWHLAWRCEFRWINNLKQNSQWWSKA